MPLVAQASAGGNAYVNQWPGVYFEASFTGKTVWLKFIDAANIFRLYIDNLKPITLSEPGKSEVKISGLGQKSHKLRLEKITESIDGYGEFDGFYTQNSTAAAAPNIRKKSIEFIGDSGMTGYGIHSSTRVCTKDEIRLRTDTQAAYPALIAKHYNADYQINAISGRGMVRNYDGFSPGEEMKGIYPFTFFNQSSPYNNTNWKPQIIIINLGANDFSTPVKPTEKWKDTEALAADYLAQYSAFLSDIFARNPDANLIIAFQDYKNSSDPVINSLPDAAEKLLVVSTRNAGFRSVKFIRVHDLGEDDAACDYHNSISDHKKIAAWWITYLDTHPELWVAPL